MAVLLAACQQSPASETTKGRGQTAAPSTVASASASASADPAPGPRPRELTVPQRYSGSHADFDRGWIAWKSDTVRYGSDHDSVWVSRLGSREPRLVRHFPKGDLGAGVTISFPYVAWVQYRETGNTTGEWKIHVYDIETRRTRTAATWDRPGAGKNQPLPLPYLDPYAPSLAWYQIDPAPEGKEMCIHVRDLVTREERTEGCTASLADFPRYPRVRDGVLSYLVNTGPGGQQGPVSVPRSPDYPQLEAEFGPSWDRFTRAVDADSRGVAWIAESTEYNGGASIYYWEPGKPVASVPTRTSRFPASQVVLTEDAVVWAEPEQVNDVLAVRRSLMGCESAVVRVAARWFRERRYEERYAQSIQLAGGSENHVLVSVRRSIQKPPYALPFTFAVFELPGLPATCEDPP